MKQLSAIDRRKLQIFDGPAGPLEFLDPNNHPPVPIVELPAHIANIPKGARARIFLQLLTYASLHNLKAIPMYWMIDQAIKDGSLDGVSVIIIASSGGAGYSTGFIARQRGNFKVVAVVPADIAQGKLEMLRYAGVYPWQHAETPENTCIDLAARLGRIKGCYNLLQYHSAHNADAHAAYTARWAWEQTAGAVGIYSAAMGTSGTACGARDFFRSKKAKTLVLGAVVAEGSAIPGARSKKRLLQVGLNYQDGITQVEVTDTAAYANAVLAGRGSGTIIGPTSGAAIAAARQFVLNAPAATLDPVRDQDGELIIVAPCPDPPTFYLDKFSTQLGPEFFTSMPEELLAAMEGVR